MNIRQQIEEIMGRWGNGLTGHEAVDAIMAVIQSELDKSYNKGRQEGNDEAQSYYHDMGR